MPTPLPRDRDRRGLSFVEVLLAAAIVAVALVPVLGMYVEQEREAAFDDFHRMARCRARRIVESLSALPYDELRELPAGGPGRAAPAPADLPPGARQVAFCPRILPPVDVELELLSGESPLPPDLAHFEGASRLLGEGAWFAELEPDGLGQVVAVVSWNVPGEPPGTLAHEFRYAAFVSRRELSLTKRPTAPPPTGAGL